VLLKRRGQLESLLTQYLVGSMFKSRLVSWAILAEG